MIVDLKAVAGAVEEGIRRGREDPDGDVGVLVNETMAVLGVGVGQGTRETGGLSRKWLDAAAEDVEAMGESVQRPLNAALLGIGYALLAEGANAEVFYAMFASGEAEVTVTRDRQ